MALRLECFIPVYNEALEVEASVLRVLAFCREQVPGPWRVTVLSNGSTDDTASIGERLARTHSEVGAVHMNGLLHRLLFNGSNLQFEGDRFAPFAPVVFAGTVVSSLLIVALALFGRVAPAARGGPLDLCAALLAAVMASPVA